MYILSVKFILDGCCVVEGLWLKVHGSWLMVEGSWFMVDG
jgi:hypothetical protein